MTLRNPLTPILTWMLLLTLFSPNVRTVIAEMTETAQKTHYTAVQHSVHCEFDRQHEKTPWASPLRTKKSSGSWDASESSPS